MRILAALFLALLGVSVAAQSRPVFDVDDFIDPRLHENPVFIPRLIGGAARDLIDGHRPVHDDAAFLSLANSLYWSRFQFDYKRSEVRTEHDPRPVFACACSHEIFFPTPPLGDETPHAPPQGSRDTLQFGWYYAVPREGERPVMLRLRLTGSRQRFDVPIHSPATGAVLSRRAGEERSIGLEGDTYLPLRNREYFGTLAWAYTTTDGVLDDRRQHALTYTQRIPAVSVRQLLLRGTLTVGGVSGRGGTALNLVSPWFEALWRERHTNINLHLIWNPQVMNDGATGWQATHQIALIADRALFVKLFQ